MKIELNDELVIAGVAEAAEKLLLSDRFIDRIADAIALHFELLTPYEAAKILDVTKETLQMNHVEWGLDKSLAFGTKNPRYFMSQVLERARAKMIKGKRRPNAELGMRSAESEEPQRVSGCFGLKERSAA